MKEVKELAYCFACHFSHEGTCPGLLPNASPDDGVA
jgi:hypothetical protein